MDRRQKKTREAIFRAFAELLSVKHYSRISVQEIIDKADIGRTTFYAHFETKDYLLKDMCEELFGHITDSAMGLPQKHSHYSCKWERDHAFLHLVQHLSTGDRNILKLLSSQNNELFIKYFKSELIRLICTQKERINKKDLPEDLIINHIATTFVETINWWIKGGTKQSPEEITDIFCRIVQPYLDTKQ